MTSICNILLSFSISTQYPEKSGDDVSTPGAYHVLVFGFIFKGELL